MESNEQENKVPLAVGMTILCANYNEDYTLDEMFDKDSDVAQGTVIREANGTYSVRSDGTAWCNEYRERDTLKDIYDQMLKEHTTNEYRFRILND